jgi:hypothetical protein
MVVEVDAVPGLDPRRIFDAEKMPLFRLFWAWIYSGWDDARLHDLRKALPCREDLLTSVRAQDELGLGMRQEGALAELAIWPGYRDPRWESEEQYGVFDEIGKVLVRGWIRRKPTGGARQPLNELLLGAANERDGYEASMLVTLANGAELGSLAFVSAIVDLAFQSQQAMGPFVMLMNAIGVKPFDLAWCMLGDLPDGPTRQDNWNDNAARVRFNLRRGSYGFLTDLPRRLELLYATGLFRSPEAVADAVRPALRELSIQTPDFRLGQETPFPLPLLRDLWLPLAGKGEMESCREAALVRTA